MLKRYFCVAPLIQIQFGSIMQSNATNRQESKEHFHFHFQHEHRNNIPSIPISNEAFSCVVCQVEWIYQTEWSIGCINHSCVSILPFHYNGLYGCFTLSRLLCRCVWCALDMKTWEAFKNRCFIASTQAIMIANGIFPHIIQLTCKNDRKIEK